MNIFKNTLLALLLFLTLGPANSESAAVNKNDIEFKVTSVTTDRQNLKVRIDGFNHGGRTRFSLLKRVCIYSSDGTRYTSENLIPNKTVAASFPFNFTVNFPALPIEETSIALVEISFEVVRGQNYERGIVEFRNVPITRTDTTSTYQPAPNTPSQPTYRAVNLFPGSWRSSTGSVIKISLLDGSPRYSIRVLSNGKLVGSSIINVRNYDTNSVSFSYDWSGAKIQGMYFIRGGEGVRVWDGTGWEANWYRI